MEGVTLLHQYTTGGPSIAGIVCAAIIALIALSVAVWGIVSILHFRQTRFKWKEVIFYLAITLTLLGGIAFTLTWDAETNFKVTIDETVPYKEFTERFEVLNIEGEIYTVRYKDGSTEWIKEEENENYSCS